MLVGVWVILQGIAWASGQTSQPTVQPTTQPATRNSAIVEGTIKLPPGALVSDIVVYL
jgi:hypothetical protein